MNTRTIKLPQYRHMFLILSALSLVSLVLYIYGINQTVRNVVLRQQMQKELTQLTSENGEKEFAYISAQNAIDLERAYALGFKDTDAKTFVTRDTNVAFAGGSNLPH